MNCERKSEFMGVMIMNILKSITEKFVKQSQDILGDNLVGIYLHGSAAMGCFNDEKSDIDLLGVINSDLSAEDKLQYMDMVVELNAFAPTKGIELSLLFIRHRLNCIFQLRI